MSYILSELIKGVSKVQRELVYQLCNKFMLHLIHFSHCFRWFCIEHWPFAYKTIICINQIKLVCWFWFRFHNCSILAWNLYLMTKITSSLTRLHSTLQQNSWMQDPRYKHEYLDKPIKCIVWATDRWWKWQTSRSTRS